MKGRINSDGSMSTASRTLRAAGGSWASVEKAAHRDENGVYVVRRSELTGREPPRDDR
jgi:ribosomal protein RSM22 (predicted rRNA methylase)